MYKIIIECGTIVILLTLIKTCLEDLVLSP